MLSAAMHETFPVAEMGMITLCADHAAFLRRLRWGGPRFAPAGRLRSVRTAALFSSLATEKWAVRTGTLHERS